MFRFLVSVAVLSSFACAPPAEGPPVETTLVQVSPGGDQPFTCLGDSILFGEGTRISRKAVAGGRLELLQAYDGSSFLYGGVYGSVSELLAFESAGLGAMRSSAGWRLFRLSDGRFFEPLAVPLGPSVSEGTWIYTVSATDDGTGGKVFELVTLDVKEPATPTVTARLPVAPGILLVRDGVLYLFEGNRLTTYSLAAPAAPRGLGALALGVTARGLGLRGAKAFTWVGDQLAVVDVSDPAAPTWTPVASSEKGSMTSFSYSRHFDALLTWGNNLGSWLDDAGGSAGVKFPDFLGPAARACFSGPHLVYVHVPPINLEPSTYVVTFPQR